MAISRLPIARDMKISEFSGGTVTDYSSYMENTIVDKISSDTGDRLIVTQRPAINIIDDASLTTAKIKGRGIYYWETTTSSYFVNDDTIYKTEYGIVIGTITSGTRRCYFYEVGALLILVDPENNEVWTIASDGILTQVTDLDLPTTIAGSGATLDGYLFLIDDLGVISHSDVDDATAWNALNFVEAERKRDAGVSLALHHDHIVALGNSSIEFFYDAANPTGSVLSRRQDIFYNVGCPYEDGVWEDGDSIYFLGRSQRGDFAIYEISNFRLKQISNPEMNAFLTSTYSLGTFSPTISGFSARGHSFIALTLHTTPDEILPVSSLIFDRSTKLWGPWTTNMTELSSLSGFPVSAWTISSSSISGIGILTNGDIIALKSEGIPVDSFDIRYYIENEDDYVVADYIAPFGSLVGTNISIVCRIGDNDGGLNSNKFGHSLEIVGSYTKGTQDLTVKWSDTDNSTFTTTRTINMKEHTMLSRLGKYNRRTYQLEYSGNEIVRLESLEYNVKGGMS